MNTIRKSSSTGAEGCMIQEKFEKRSMKNTSGIEASLSLVFDPLLNTIKFSEDYLEKKILTCFPLSVL